VYNITFKDYQKIIVTELLQLFKTSLIFNFLLKFYLEIVIFKRYLILFDIITPSNETRCNNIELAT
ncbi:hypothetical protein, partial [Staphylococcus epidermidis]|uniref:hypothetical protein n=1 Tax=Staphylococcus epidermidis TaxID=1282 RepID=UPI001C8EAF5F